MKKKFLVGAALSVIVTAAGTGLNTRPVDAADGKSASNKNTTQSASSSAEDRSAAKQADLKENQEEDKKKAEALKKRVAGGESLTAEEEAWLTAYDARAAKEAEDLILDPSTEVLTEPKAVSLEESTVSSAETEAESTDSSVDTAETPVSAEHSAASAEQHDAAESESTAASAESVVSSSESVPAAVDGDASRAESTSREVQSSISQAESASETVQSDTSQSESASETVQSDTSQSESASEAVQSDTSQSESDADANAQVITERSAASAANAAAVEVIPAEPAASDIESSTAEVIPAEPIASDAEGSPAKEAASAEPVSSETADSSDAQTAESTAEEAVSAAKPAVRHAVMRIAQAAAAPDAASGQNLSASAKPAALTEEETQTIEDALTSTELIAADGKETELALKKAELLFTSSLKMGYSLQGSTAIGNTKIAYAFINDDDDSDITLLYMYDATTGKITLMNDKLRLGHASSLTWNSKTNEVMILDGSTVHILDADTLQKKGTAQASESGFGIAYNADDDTYILRDSKKFWIADNKFNYVRGFPAKVNPMGQGMGYNNGIVYLVDSDYYSGKFTNNIRAYDTSGNLLKTFNITDILGECEEVSFQNGSMILGYIRGWKMPDYNYPVRKGAYNWTVEFYKSNDYILNYGKNGIQTLPSKASENADRGQSGKGSGSASQGKADPAREETKSVLLNTGNTGSTPAVKKDAPAKTSQVSQAETHAAASQATSQQTAAGSPARSAVNSSTTPASPESTGTRPAASVGTAAQTASQEPVQAHPATSQTPFSGQHTDLSFGTDYDLIDPVAGENLTTGGSADVTDPVTSSGSIDYSPVYDYDYYLSHNPDVASEVGNDKKAALDHFVKKGMAEGRQAKENFDVSSYRNANQDLRILFGSDLKPYFMHYIRTGYAEGRRAVGVSVLQNPVMVYNGVDFSKIYDYFFYVNKYTDLPASIRNDDVKALRYFGTYGIFNGQIAKRLYSAADYLDVLKHLI